MTKHTTSASTTTQTSERKSYPAWRQFDEAVFQWSRAARSEMMEEWRQEARGSERRRMPELKVEVPDSEYAVDVGGLSIE